MNLFLTFAMLVCKIMFIAHWVACIFWYVGKDEMNEHPNCWIRRANLQDSPFNEQYVTSLYWAFTTMITVGYGDVVPVTINERLYCMVAMLIASGVFAYTINSIGAIVSRYNILAGQYKEKMTYVNQFMLAQNIPKDLRLKIRRYLEYKWETKKEIKIEEKEVMAMLNENLKEKITVYLNGRILKSMGFFDSFGLDFLSELTFYFKTSTYAVDDYVFQEGEESKSLFYMVQGKVAIVHKQSHTYIVDLIKNEHFGEIGFFTDNRRLCSAKSRDFTEVYLINKTDFLHIIEDYIPAIVSAP